MGEVIIGQLPIYKRPVEDTKPVVIEDKGERSEPLPPTPKASIKTALNQKQRGAIGRKMIADFVKANEGKIV